jgi:hypothetical protein
MKRLVQKPAWIDFATPDTFCSSIIPKKQTCTSRTAWQPLLRPLCLHQHQRQTGLDISQIVRSTATFLPWGQTDQQYTHHGS